MLKIIKVPTGFELMTNGFFKGNSQTYCHVVRQQFRISGKKTIWQSNI